MERRTMLALLTSCAMPSLALAQNTTRAAATREPAGGEIVLGQTADFSSSRAAISKAYAEGAGLVFQQVNATGGVHGRRIRVLQLDDAYEVQRAEENATLGIDNFGFLHDDEPFGHGVRSNVQSAVEEFKTKLVASISVPPNQLTAEAVAPAVRLMLQASPKAVVIGSAGPVIEKFVRAYQEAGGRTQFYCLSVANVERLVRDLGLLSEGIVVAQVMPDVRTSNLPVVREYREAAARRDATAGVFGLEGFISARIIVQARRDAGETPTRARFIAGLERQTQVGSFPVKYQDARQGSPFVELSMIGRGGKSVR